MKYRPGDFRPNDAWLIFRLDTQVKNQPVDIYMVMDLPSTMILTLDTIEAELSQKQADKLLKEAKMKSGKKPRRLILAKGDPAETVLLQAAEKMNISFESVPSAYLEELTAPLKEEFGKEFFSPSTLGYTNLNNDVDALDRESVKRMLPDSYDLCSCASGKKYKFCCKKILSEIMEAMVAAEDGNYTEALQWIKKAKVIAGETAEVLCREAIIYSYFDSKKSEDILNNCLSINPIHPRAHYIRGLSLKEQGDFHNAVTAYETAISNYPETDHYHLNEAYNNLGTVFHALRDLVKAKIAWEKALLYLPSDKTARDNLAFFIYDRPIG
jgi:tetratricopeptide (TPR) repeat protein